MIRYGVDIINEKMFDIYCKTFPEIEENVIFSPHIEGYEHFKCLHTLQTAWIAAIYRTTPFNKTLEIKMENAEKD